MQTQIFLIAPADAETATFAAQLKTVLETHEVSALLLPRGSRAENAYKDFAKKIIPIGQAGGAAVLLEGAPGLVKMLNADGLHVTGADAERTREAVEAPLVERRGGAGAFQGGLAAGGPGDQRQEQQRHRRGPPEQRRATAPKGRGDEAQGEEADDEAGVGDAVGRDLAKADRLAGAVEAAGVLGARIGQGRAACAGVWKRLDDAVRLIHRAGRRPRGGGGQHLGRAAGEV